ncbi:MAG: hypothetical protein QW770_04195 [Candidatus Bathyarchaeia archaeon]
MVKRGPNPRYNELIRIWIGRENEELSFNEVLQEARKLGFQRATTINYLNKLVQENVLQKTVDLRRQTFYKPREAILVKREALKQTVEAVQSERIIESIEKLASLEPYIKIVDFLALHRGVSRKQLAHSLGFSEEQCATLLNTLLQNGFVNPCEEGFELTFTGVLFSLKYGKIEWEKLDTIAENYKDKWIIFEEWAPLTMDEDVKRLMLNALLAYLNREQLLYIPDEKSLKVVGEIFGAPVFHKLFENKMKEDATLEALYLDYIFNYGLFPEGDAETPAGKAILKLWRVCAKSPVLRAFIQEQVEQARRRMEGVEKFAEFFKRLAIEEAA